MTGAPSRQDLLDALQDAGAELARVQAHLESLQAQYVALEARMAHELTEARYAAEQRLNEAQAQHLGDVKYAATREAMALDRERQMTDGLNAALQRVSQLRAQEAAARGPAPCGHMSADGIGGEFQPPRRCHEYAGHGDGIAHNDGQYAWGPDGQPI